MPVSERPAPLPRQPLVHFLEEQRRHRRTSALTAALVVVTLALSGIPLSVVVSPLVVAIIAIPVRLADLVIDVPPALDHWVDRALRLLPELWAAIRRPDVDLPWDLLIDLFVLPGFVAMVLVWAVVRFTFRHTGVGGVLRRMEARPPRTGDLPEQRLVNLVQEVAVAAGVPPPRVLIIDSAAANAGAAGLRMDDATVVVTRGFLDKLPRDAQQAVIAHVMASVGNGDLTVAAELMTVIQVWGMVILALEAPFLPQARRWLKQVGRTAVETMRGRADVASREQAVDTLIAGAGYEVDIDSDDFERLPEINPLVLVFGYGTLLMTIGPAAIFAKTIVWLTLFISGPLLSALWRTRRRLADATAVELTRYPEALHQALRRLASLNVKVPGAVAVHFLFPVWDPKVDQDHSRTEVASALLHLHLAMEPRLRRLERLGASPERPKRWTPQEGYTRRDIAAAAGWIGVGVVFLGVVLAVCVVGAGAVLYVMGRVL